MRLRQFWINLMASLWFIPGIIVLGAIWLAIGMVGLDLYFKPGLSETMPLIFGVGAEGSRSTLSTIAGSMSTIAGVVFSITIVALSLASNQYSPRVLRNFMSDRMNQSVLGVFIGIYVYCLLVLRTIRENGEEFIPTFAVLTGVVLALVGMGFLIFFIHHIAASIQAAHILASISKETLRAIEHAFPETLADGEDDTIDGDIGFIAWPTQWQPVPARRSGYIQTVDIGALFAAAKKGRMVIRMERGTGEFVVEDTPLALIDGPDAPDVGIIRRINAAYRLDRQRTVEQDPAFGIRQLVDMAIKALSPGIYDTTTAVMCTHYLTVILVRLCRRRIGAPYRFEDGELRLIIRGASFEILLGNAINQIRSNAEGNVAVLTSLLHMLGAVADMTTSKPRLEMLRDQAAAVVETARRSIPAERDRAAVNSLTRRLVAMLDPEAVFGPAGLSARWRI